MEETIDLFENYDALPWIVRSILETKDEDKNSWLENDRLIEELAPHGYIFDYGLCGDPIDLKRIYNEELMALVEEKGVQTVLTTGTDMQCKQVVCRGILYKKDEQFIYKGSDGISTILDNLCDVYIDTFDNLQLIRKRIKEN